MKTFAKTVITVLVSGIIAPLFIFTVLKGANDAFFEPPIHVSDRTFLISYAVLGLGTMIWAVYYLMRNRN